MNKFVVARKFKPVYRTRFGRAYAADCLDLLSDAPANSVNLVITSPPFALRRRKSYGNVDAAEYVDWFLPFAEQIHRVLTDDGSFVIDLGGSWERGEPIRSLYHFELLLTLCRKGGLFKLAQEFYWYNPAKMPGPAEWVTVRRVRVKDAVNTVWWLSKTSAPKASNRHVLQTYTKSMKNLMSKGYNMGKRPSEHVVSAKWGTDNGGAIPPNIIIAANTSSRDPYLDACRKLGMKVHPARFVPAVPDFFVRFLTEPGDLVVDPFAGSNVVGLVAEQRKRRWVSTEINREYVDASAYRFSGPAVGNKSGSKAPVRRNVPHDVK